MDAKEYLKDYVKKVGPILQDFFSKKITEARKISPICVDMLKKYQKYMEGGKKARGGLVVLGYKCAGGKDERAIIEVSIAVEIVHSFLLMHDDVMDQDVVRRGRPAMHRQYAQLHRKRYKKGDPEHYGLSMAIDVGDTGPFLAYEILVKSSFSKKRILEAISHLNGVYLDTAYGQALDVTLEHCEKVSPGEVLLIFRLKTARYSVSGPSQLGAILAGASPDYLNLLEKYGEPVGIAFQIQDDILGTFGNEKTLGKAVDRDIKEGKNTLLIVKALEWANRKQRKFLKEHYGKEDLSQSEAEKIKKIIRDTGALEYSNKVGWQLIEKGKKYIGKITKDPYYQRLLASFADFVMERKH